MDYNQVELDQVVEHFLGTLPENSPQGHGSPMVDTMHQASLYAMKDKLESMALLDLVAQDPKTNKALVSTSTAKLIHRECYQLRQAHQNGAATEFQIQK
eukprot:3332105-Karenia_brevis.AAC.1